MLINYLIHFLIKLNVLLFSLFLMDPSMNLENINLIKIYKKFKSEEVEILTQSILQVFFIIKKCLKRSFVYKDFNFI